MLRHSPERLGAFVTDSLDKALRCQLRGRSVKVGLRPEVVHYCGVRDVRPVSDRLRGRVSEPMSCEKLQRDFENGRLRGSFPTVLCHTPLPYSSVCRDRVSTTSFPYDHDAHESPKSHLPRTNLARFPRFGHTQSLTDIQSATVGEPWRFCTPRTGRSVGRHDTYAGQETRLAVFHMTNALSSHLRSKLDELLEEDGGWRPRCRPCDCLHMDRDPPQHPPGNTIPARATSATPLAPQGSRTRRQTPERARDFRYNVDK